MNILVVDDQADIREIVTFALNYEFKANVESAISGNKAIELLKEKKFDLVVCDYHMPDGNGLLVHDFLKSQPSQTKFVFCSSESEEVLEKATNVFFFIRKPNIFDYIKMLKRKISEDETLAADAVAEYSEMNASLTESLSPLPFDLYLKLSENNYVKYYSQGHTINPADLEAIKSKGVGSFFVKGSEIHKGKQQLIELIQRMLEEENSIPGAVSMHEYVSQYFREFGFDSRVQEMVEKNMKATINMIMKEPELESCLLKLLGLGSYSKKLVAISTCFATHLLKSVNLLNEQTLMKLMSAIYLQDMFVIRNEYLPLYTKEEAKGYVWKHPRDEEGYFLHPVRASEFIKKTKSILPDVEKMVLESHELPCGKGFPRGLSASQIAPLSCVLILSNMLAREYLKLETAFPVQEYLHYLNKTHGLDQGNFKKIYDAALTVKFFPKN